MMFSPAQLGYYQETVGHLPPTRLELDAIASTNRRRAPRQTTQAEDRYLAGNKRRKLVATTRDVHRNFVVCAWAIRKHLDYVTQFHFQAKTKNRDFNRVLETFVYNWQLRQNYDIAGRHRMPRMLRMAEARRIVDGDILMLKLAGSGPGDRRRGKIQAIEADRITSDAAGSPTGDNWTHGVKTNADGAATHYALARRKGTTLEHERIIRAENAYLHAYYDSTQRIDQIRGIGPITQSLNNYRDTYTGFDLALATLRIQQLFALKITRDQYYEETGEEGIPTEDLAGEAPTPDLEAGAPKPVVDMTDGPAKLELDKGEDAEFLTSKTPSNETVGFLMLMLRIAILSLDLPTSFLDEAHTNFFGSRAALMHYLRSAKNKRQDNGEMLDDETAWRFALAVFDGEIELPRGMLFEDLDWEWIPDGVPWWDPSKEVRGHAEAIAKALDNPQRICRETGTDLYDNIDLIAEAMKYAGERGLSINYLSALAGGQTPAPGDGTALAADLAEEIAFHLRAK